jgi:hypothetical protein
MSETLILPDELRLSTEQWLDDVEAGVVRLEDAYGDVTAADAAALRAAIADVRTCTSFAKRMFAGAVPLGALAHASWVPIAKPSPELAAAIFSRGYEFAQTPFALLEQGKALLTPETYKSFSLEVAYVLASTFTNLTRAVWDDYAQYAPPGWNAPK